MAPRVTRASTALSQSMTSAPGSLGAFPSGKLLMTAFSVLLALTWHANLKLEKIAAATSTDLKNVAHSEGILEKIEGKVSRMYSYVNEKCICPYKPIIPTGKHIDKVIESHLNRYDADKIARMDFAMESAGGRIVAVKSTKAHQIPSSPSKKAWAQYFDFVCDQCEFAKPILQPHVGVGDCWSFEGTKGTVVIRLARKIYLDGVTIEHIPARLSPTGDIQSAPKDFTFSALNHPEDAEPAQHFGRFRFEKLGPPIQQFNFSNKSRQSHDLVAIDFESNWGNEAYTSVYRVRVHGSIEP